MQGHFLLPHLWHLGICGSVGIGRLLGDELRSLELLSSRTGQPMVIISSSGPPGDGVSSYPGSQFLLPLILLATSLLEWLAS